MTILAFSPLLCLSFDLSTCRALGLSLSVCKTSDCDAPRFDRGVEHFALDSSAAADLTMCEPNCFHLAQKIEDAAFEIAQISPDLLIGSGNLVQFDPKAHLLTLSTSFSGLLGNLVKLGELDPAVMKVRTLKS